MLNKIFAICLVFLFVTSPVLIARHTYIAAPTVHAQIVDPCNDPDLAPSSDCPPPTFQVIEFVVVRVIYFMWGFTGVIFMIFLLRIGWMYYFSNGEQERIAEARRMAVRWFIGLLIIFFARPLIATVMSELVADNDNCFDNLNDPGFTFFFEEACTDGD